MCEEPWNPSDVVQLKFVTWFQHEAPTTGRSRGLLLTLTQVTSYNINTWFQVSARVSRNYVWKINPRKIGNFTFSISKGSGFNLNTKVWLIFLGRTLRNIPTPPQQCNTRNIWPERSHLQPKQVEKWKTIWSEEKCYCSIEFEVDSNLINESIAKPLSFFARKNFYSTTRWKELLK